MRSDDRSLRLTDPWLLALSGLLTALGVAMVYSAGQVDIPSPAVGAWRRQLAWVAVALGTFYAVSRVPLRWLDWLAPWFYGVSVVLLTLTLVMGTGPGATRSWLELGPFRMQPAEPAKLATLLMLARTLSGSRSRPSRLTELGPPLAVAAAPFLLVLLQPDLGSALLFGVVLVAALFWSGVSLTTIFLLVSPGISLAFGFSAWAWGAWFVALGAFLYYERPYVLEGAAVVLANVGAGALTLPVWERLAPYQQNRLLVFLNPELDPQGAGWQLIQSKVAIGSGGWLGKGFAQGPQKRLAFLPEQHTDFIFSVVGEELGFLGVLAFLVLFGVWLSRVLRATESAPNEFASIAVFSLFAVWLTHLLVNVGMTVGLMPITGLPLPFLSYGGSFLVVTWAGLAVAQRSLRER